MLHDLVRRGRGWTRLSPSELPGLIHLSSAVFFRGKFSAPWALASPGPQECPGCSARRRPLSARHGERPQMRLPSSDQSGDCGYWLANSCVGAVKLERVGNARSSGDARPFAVTSPSVHYKMRTLLAHATRRSIPASYATSDSVVHGLTQNAPTPWFIRQHSQPPLNGVHTSGPSHQRLTPGIAPPESSGPASATHSTV